MRYRVLAFLCLIAAISYVQRAGLNAAAGAVQRDHDINTEQFGMLGSAWLLGYALMQVPAGWLADRFGSKRTLTVLAVLWSVLTGTIGLCPTYPLLLAQWFVTGMALAGVFPCTAKSIGAWFPDAEKATASGLLGSSTMLGAALAITALTSWAARPTRLVVAGRLRPVRRGGRRLGAGLRRGRAERGGPQTGPRRMTGADCACWRRVRRCGWCACNSSSAGAMIFFINWFPKFLTEVRHLDELQAGLGTSYANLASLVGGVTAASPPIGSCTLPARAAWRARASPCSAWRSARR